LFEIAKSMMSGWSIPPTLSRLAAEGGQSRQAARQQAKAPIVQDEARKLSLQTSPDEAILRLVRALARQAAREDHEKEHAARRNEEESRDLCSILDRSSE
jgi:hypothetical protein